MNRTTHLVCIGLALVTAGCHAAEDVEGAASSIGTCAPAAGASPDAVIDTWLATSGTDREGMLARVAAVAGEARIVGLGEPDHGFHEFAEFRNAVFGMLVEKKGFRAIALETGIVEARVVDRYVTDVDGKTGVSLDDALAHGFTHDAGAWEETAELVSWVRRHNERAAKRGEPLVRWGGKGPSARGDTLEVPLAQLAPFFEKVGARAKLRRLEELAAKASEITTFMESNVRAIDPDHLDAVTSLSYDQLSDDERDEVGAELAALLRDLDTHRDVYAAKTSKDAFEWAQSMVIVAEQIRYALEERMDLGVVYGPTPSGGSLAYITKVFHRAGRSVPAVKHVRFVDRDFTPAELETNRLGRSIREVHRAENVVRLEKRFGRTLDFGANAHLRKDSSLVDGGSVVEGQFLVGKFGAGYVVLGGTTTEFESPAQTGDASRDARAQALKASRAAQMAHPGSFEARFDRSPRAGLFVEVRPDRSCARPGPVADWLGTEQLTWFGATKAHVVPERAFDAVYWLRKVTRARER